MRSCGPVHNLGVLVCLLSEKGVTFSGRRAKGEEKSEFLSSTTIGFGRLGKDGPDGACGLWI